MRRECNKNIRPHGAWRVQEASISINRYDFILCVVVNDEEKFSHCFISIFLLYELYYGMQGDLHHQTNQSLSPPIIILFTRFSLYG